MYAIKVYEGVESTFMGYCSEFRFVGWNVRIQVSQTLGAKGTTFASRESAASIASEGNRRNLNKNQKLVVVEIA